MLNTNDLLRRFAANYIISVSEAISYDGGKNLQKPMRLIPQLLRCKNDFQVLFTKSNGYQPKLIKSFLEGKSVPKGHLLESVKYLLLLVDNNGKAGIALKHSHLIQEKFGLTRDELQCLFPEMELSAHVTD